jgi:hypothetical protein
MCRLGVIYMIYKRRMEKKEQICVPKRITQVQGRKEIVRRRKCREGHVYLYPRLTTEFVVCRSLASLLVTHPVTMAMLVSRHQTKEIYVLNYSIIGRVIVRWGGAPWSLSCVLKTPARIGNNCTSSINIGRYAARVRKGLWKRNQG